MSRLDTAIANLIARTALDHYLNELPPRKGKPQNDQWTVYSAIVATRRGEENQITQSQQQQGTGTANTATATATATAAATAAAADADASTN